MTTRMWRTLAGTVALCLAAGASGAEAATLQAQDNGFYNSAGIHVTVSANTFTGYEPGPLSYRSWYQFDASGAAAAKSISITFYGQGVFSTDTGTETITLFDYTGSIDSLLAGSGGVAAFDDLGSGAALGDYTLTQANNSAAPTFTVHLSNAFVTQFNSARGSADPRVALGAALTTIDTTAGAQAVWGYSDRLPAAYLTIESAAAPEPATWAIMILGFGAAGTAIRSRRRRVARA